MKRRWLIVLFVLAVLYAGHRLTLHWMVQAKLNGIRKQGYPVNRAELERWSALPPNSENAAEVYVEASSHFADFKDKKRDDWLPIVGFGKLPMGTEPLSNVAWTTAATRRKTSRSRWNDDEFH